MSKVRFLHYDVIAPRQSAGLPVFTFAARAADIARFARIDRAGRNDDGVLQGFQRPQIAGHIREIRDYLEKPTAILPNPIVVAFTGAATLEPLLPFEGSGTGQFNRLTIDVAGGPPGWIVDGQQRFTALSELRDRDFEVLVSGFICDSLEELQKQFILINNTRPLPKALVYELLPQVTDLPQRMSNRSQAALMTEALNYRPNSSLRGLIRQQTNPKGIIRDTVLQRVIMNSLSDGALRLYADDNRLLLERGVNLVSEFFHAVKHVFEEDWVGKTPKTSRLVHGAGIIAMGYVMEALHVMTGAEERDAFARGLRLLKGQTAWSSGEWSFGEERRRWNGLQNVPSDVRQLSLYLVGELKRLLPRAVEAA
ncbi:DGQHR domain-containing protein [Azospirillum melinis]|uniref:DGQHR domain-containing protein n=1 Tax=Azospirillum melinis TaxID=328839 RepID=A0ABX2KPU5_9PROT|nr:DGQHR domain-containing protein DpdB [Azospirillum melinis]MBP2305986.1 DGQHR domain-containing protein [Azospirillum melinis]NUB03491.1 DGQHR domain-containing protein [Azospirillum melinis]